MNHPAAAIATGSTAGDRRNGQRRDVVAALAITTTIGYGVLYYAFSALLAPMSQDLRISTTTATGALTTAVLVSAAMAIPIGRRLDARGGHGVMTAGSLLATAAVLAWSQVQTAAQLYAVFVAIGAASAMVLYQPAFAITVSAILTLQGIAIALLPFIGGTVTGAAISLILFGLGFGVASIATPAILLDRYGDEGYATIAGILGTPTTISRATAPLAAAALTAVIGYRPLILGAAAACITAGLFLALTRRRDRAGRLRRVARMRPGRRVCPSSTARTPEA